MSALRDEYSQTFATPAGRFVTESSLRPQRVRLTGGSWMPVDTTLRRNADGSISPIAAVADMRFSGGGSSALAAMADGTKSLKLFWPDGLPAPVLKDNLATYSSVLPGVDLEVRAEADSFVHMFVIRTRKALTNPALARLGLRTELAGVSLRVDEATGAVAAVDQAGTLVFGGPTPTMWDSRDSVPVTPSSLDEPAKADRELAEPRRAAVRVEVGADRLTLVPDAGMLADPTTVLPIYVDPTWQKTTGAKNHWTMLRESEPGRSFYDATALSSSDGTRGIVRVSRNTYEGPVYKDRSLFDMNVSAVRYKHIYRAVFSLTQAWAGPGCGGPYGTIDLRPVNAFDRNTKWSTAWNTNNSGWGASVASSSAVYRYGNSCGPRRVEFHVTGHVAGLAAAGRTNAYLGLRGRSESGDNEWKRYKLDPGLSIEWNSVPNAPVNQSADAKGCGTESTPSAITTATPTLSSKASDVDASQQNLTTWFYWWAQGGARNETDKVSQSTANGGTASTAVPSGRLADDTTYVWQVLTKDDVGDGQWSGLCYLRVDSSPPNPPKTVVSTEYPSSGAHGGVGVTGTFAFNPPDVKPQEVVSYAYTLDTGVSAAQAPRIAANPTDRKAQVTLRPLWDGAHTLRVWTVDSAGRASTTPLTYTFTVAAGAGPAAHWDFEARPTASPAELACNGTDVARHGNTLTLSGTTCASGRAGVGNAKTATGEYGATPGPVTYPNPGGGAPVAFHTDSDFTVAAWVRLSSIPTANRPAVAANGSQTAAFWMGYEITSGRWGLRLHGTDTNTPSTYTVVSTAVPVAGQWTHLAGVYDAQADTIRIYVNGELQPGMTTVSALFNATGPVSVGRMLWASGWGHNWPGDLDDIRLYPYLLSASDIDDLADPLAPAVSFPNGSTVDAGQSIDVTFSAGGDANVTSFQYSVDSESYNQTATPNVPGGQATVTIPTSVTGSRIVYVRAVDITTDTGASASATFEVRSPPSSSSLSGIVTDAVTGDPVDGAAVRLDPGGHSMTTGSDGLFQFTTLTAGQYMLSAVVGDRCALSAATRVTVDRESAQPLVVSPLGDSFGYTCRVAPQAFVPANTTVLSLSGDDAVASVSLPFTMIYYGTAYTTAWVDTNGIVSLVDPGGSSPNGGASIPSPAGPNATIAPFWDDLVVDGSSSVRTAVIGTAPSREFVIEWRNVHRKGDTGQRITFEVLLGEANGIVVNYADLTGAAEQGEHASVGIESTGGEVGIQYSYRQPVLVSGTAVSFDYPLDPTPIGVFDLSGTVEDPSGTPMVGASVTLEPAGVTAITTAPDGRYTFPDLETGSYAVTVATGLRCGTYGLTEVDLRSNLADADVAMARISDETGTTCADGSRTFVPANGTVLVLGGDEMVEQVSLPFPVILYSQAYTTAWVDTNGVITFEEPDGTSWDTSEIPSPSAPNRPNSAVYPFWNDWVVDGSASVRTAVTGTTPNRQYIVEWRNVHLFDDPTTRVTFEVVFGEDGEIAFGYTDIDPASSVERGGMATVGIENPDGTVALQYLHRETGLSSGLGVWFQAGPPHYGAVSGAVTCNGVAVNGAQVRVAGQSTSQSAGSYQLSNLPVGRYSVVATAGSGACEGSTALPVTVAKDETVTVDVALTPGAGYAVTAGPRSFVPANDTDLGLSGDDAFTQVTLPFTVTLYGQAYSTAWVDINGVVAFEQPGGPSWDVSPIPEPATTNRPDAAVYPFWNDWVVGAGASVRTAVTGTTPNRQFIVEWRNVHDYSDVNLHASFEVVFFENGDIAFAYDIGPTFIEQGGLATVGIENADGTIAIQYLHRHPALRRGDGLLFQPV